MESSRTHFEVLGLEGQVLGLGLEASSPRKLACPRAEDSTIFWIQILWSAWKIFWKTFSCGDRLKNFCEDLFLFVFGEYLSLESATEVESYRTYGNLLPVLHTFGYTSYLLSVISVIPVIRLANLPNILVQGSSLVQLLFPEVLKVAKKVL